MKADRGPAPARKESLTSPPASCVALGEGSPFVSGPVLSSVKARGSPQRSLGSLGSKTQDPNPSRHGVVGGRGSTPEPGPRVLVGQPAAWMPRPGAAEAGPAEDLVRLGMGRGECRTLLWTP